MKVHAPGEGTQILPSTSTPYLPSDPSQYLPNISDMWAKHSPGFQMRPYFTAFCAQVPDFSFWEGRQWHSLCDLTQPQNQPQSKGMQAALSERWVLDCQLHSTLGLSYQRYSHPSYPSSLCFIHSVRDCRAPTLCQALCEAVI